jgi:hypothetical protein
MTTRAPIVSLAPVTPSAAYKRALTRREALRIGSRHYRGRLCGKPGEVDRYAANGGCVRCVLESSAATKERERALRGCEVEINI